MAAVAAGVLGAVFQKDWLNLAFEKFEIEWRDLRGRRCCLLSVWRRSVRRSALGIQAVPNGCEEQK
jgi:hypothetical protein